MSDARGAGGRERGGEWGEAGSSEITQGLAGSGKKLDFILSITEAIGGFKKINHYCYCGFPKA